MGHVLPVPPPMYSIFCLVHVIDLYDRFDNHSSLMYLALYVQFYPLFLS